MPTLRPRFSTDKEGVILKIEPLLDGSKKIRIIVKPESLDGGRWNDHAMLNIEDDYFVSLERNYSIITTFTELSEAMSKDINLNNIKSVFGKTIVFGRCGLDANTALREIVKLTGSSRMPMSKTICSNKLRIDYDWIYISGLRMSDDESVYRKRIVDHLHQNIGRKYKIGNFRSQAMKMTEFTKDEDRELAKAMEEYRRERWILHKSHKLMYHNKYGHFTDYTFKYNYTILADGAFNTLYNLTQITIPNSVKFIGAGCFSGCSKLTELHLSKNLESIGPSCFSNCSSLKRLVIPNSVTEIESLAFMRCESLFEIVMSDNLQHIGWNLFEGCQKNLNIYINKDYEDNLRKVLDAYSDNLVVLCSSEIKKIIESINR